MVLKSKKSKSPSIKFPKRQFYIAIISSGRYNTKDYYSKEYKTKAGLSRGLRAHGFKSNEVINGETWNVGAKQYKVIWEY